jgi:hypothetical protein
MDVREEIDGMIAGIGDWRGKVMADLRRIIREADPEMTEALKWRRPTNPGGTPVYEHNGIVCVTVVLKERVRLTMNDGAALPDPHHLYNAMLNGKSRAIDFSEGETLDEPALKEPIKAGVAMNLARVKPAKSRKKPAG